MASTAASVSSYNSLGSDGSGVGRGKLNLRGDGENAKDIEQPQTLQTGIFGVLFTLSKEKMDSSWKVAVLKLLLDWIQLYTIVMSPSNGWNFSSGGAWWIVNWINITPLVQPWGYNFFLALLYLMVGALIMAVLLCIWVAWSFKNKTFAQVWPIVVVKFFVGVFFQVFDVASLNLFQIAMSCQIWGPYTAAQQYHLQAFPDESCQDIGQIIHAAVSACTLLLFVALVTLVNMAEFEMNPLSQRPFACAHSGVEIQGFLIKFLMTLVATFVGYYIPQSFLLLFLSIYLFWLHFRWEPFASGVTNHVRVGMYFSIVYVCVTYCALAISPQNSVAITIAMYSGVVPAMILGGVVSYYRVRAFTNYVLKRFRLAEPDAVARDIYEFEDPRDVEMVMRCCRVWIKPGIVDPEAVKMAERVVKAGMQLFPNNSFMIMTYSNFLIEVQGAVQSGYSQLHAAKKANPSLMMKFAIFSREQLHMQQAATEKSGQNGVDLISYVEFQRHQRRVIQAHKEALITIRHFWQLLLRTQISFMSLSRALHRIDESVVLAEKMYKVVLEQYPSAVRILKLYAMFLEDVKNDPAQAEQYFAEVEKLEGKSDDEQFGEGLDDAGEDANGLLKAAGKNNAVIVINSIGIIQMVNKVACTAFGVQRTTDLKGKNVSVLIPPPFSQHHDTYVRNYIRTGKEHILNSVREWIALHRERYVMPCRVSVGKVSGTGEDSVFMGVLQFMPIKGSEAKVWTLPSGIIVSVDLHFSDWFGYRAEDLVGTNITTLATDADAMTSFLESEAVTRVYMDQRLPPNESSSFITAVKSIMIHHKYTDPVECGMDIRIGGGVKVRLCIFTFHRTNRSGQMVVTDTKGQCVYMTSSLAEELGYRLTDIRNVHVSELITHPFSYMHQKTWLMEHEKDSPPWSCRSGAPVMLITARGRSRIPAKLVIKSSHVNGEMLHIIAVEVLNNANMLDMNRLRMYVNRSGIVTWVAPSPTSLFNFRPELLVGRSLSLCVDILRMAADEGRLLDLVEELADKALEAPGESFRVNVIPPLEEEDMRKLGSLAENIIEQVTEHAIMTVGDPMSGHKEAYAFIDNMMIHKAKMEMGEMAEGGAVVMVESKQTLEEMLMEDEVTNDLNKLIDAPTLRSSIEPNREKSVEIEEATVMGSKSTETTFEQQLSRFTGSAGKKAPATNESYYGTKNTELSTITRGIGSLFGSRRTTMMSLGGLKSVEPGFGEIQKVMESTPGKMSSLGSRIGSKNVEWGLGTLNSNATRGEGIPEGDEDELGSFGKIAWRPPEPGVEFEVGLWRMDMLSAVVEVDKDGFIAKLDDSPMFQAGLIFGLRNEALAGRHLQTLIGWPGAVSGLLRKEGGMRGALKAADGGARAVGPVHVLHAKHSDGSQLTVTVQAVGQDGVRKHMSLMLHVTESAAPPEDVLVQLDQNHRQSSLGITRPQQSMEREHLSNVPYAPGGPSSTNESGNLAAGVVLRDGQPSSPSTNLAASNPSVPSGGAALKGLPSRKSSRSSILSAAPPRSPRVLTIPLQPSSSSGRSHKISMNEDSANAMEFSAALIKVPSALPAPREDGSLPKDIGSVAKSGSDDVVDFDGGAHAVIVDAAPKPRKSSPQDPPRSPLPMDRVSAWVMGAESESRSPFQRQQSDDVGDEGDEEEEVLETKEVSKHESHHDDEHVYAAQAAPLPVVLERAPSLKRSQSLDSRDYSASEVSSADDMAHQTNYRRAKRYKKLVRLLTDASATRWIRRLNIQSMVAVGILLVAHVVCFAILIVYLNQQLNNITFINNAGNTFIYVEQICTLVRVVQQYILGQAPTTYAAYAPAGIVPYLASVSVMLRSLHESLYLQANTPQLVTLWNSPTLIEHYIYSVYPVAENEYRNVSLWQLGNDFLDNVNDFVDFYDTYGHNISSATSFQFIINNGPFTLHPAYESVMNEIIQSGVDTAQTVDWMELIVLGLEAGLLCFVISAYVWWLLMKVSQHRYNLYSVFLAIPMGLTRTLASKSIALNSDDESDDDDVAVVAGAGVAAPTEAGTGGPSAMGGGTAAVGLELAEAPGNMNTSKVVISTNPRESSSAVSHPAHGTTAKEEGAPEKEKKKKKKKEKEKEKENADGKGQKSWFKNMVKRSLSGTIGKGTSSKRTLVYKTYEDLWFMTPFIAFAVVLAVIYSICYIEVGNMDILLGPFMASASTQANAVKMIYVGQEYCAATDFTYQSTARSWLNATMVYTQATYNLWVYGIVPPANVGYPWGDLLYSGLNVNSADVVNVLYNNNCLRTSPEPCLSSSNPYYTIANRGLDSVMRRMFYEATNMLEEAQSAINTNFTSLQYMLTVGLIDAEDGFTTLRTSRTNNLNSHYTMAIILQIIALVVCFVLMFIFVMFLLRPFVARNRKESYRIAELLSQLSSDVDVEKLLISVMGRGKGNQSGARPKGIPMQSSGRSSGIEKVASGRESFGSFNKQQGSFRLNRKVMPGPS